MFSAGCGALSKGGRRGGEGYVGVAMSVISDRKWEHSGGAVSDPTPGDRKNVCRFSCVEGSGWFWDVLMVPCGDWSVVGLGLGCDQLRV